MAVTLDAALNAQTPEVTATLSLAWARPTSTTPSTATTAKPRGGPDGGGGKAN
jgi:hypothetical protein